MSAEHKPQPCLVVGNDGRTHVIGHMLDRSSHVGNIYFAPGNGGTEQLGTNLDIDANDIDKITQFAVEQNIALTVISPEDPLAKGVVDALLEDHREAFGPTQDAARIESSKADTVRFMEKHGIPFPESIISSDPDEVHHYIDNWPYEGQLPVLKPDGLTGGKGVALPERPEDGHNWVNQVMIDRIYKDAGATVVMQRRMNGPELSILAFSDGHHVFPLVPAQDFKRRYSSEHSGPNPNTGGMASFAPVPWVTPEMMQDIELDILYPAIEGMADEGRPFVGILYAGLMSTSEGMKVIEFNCRGGDPESQVVLPLMESDMFLAMQASTRGRLQQEHVVMSNRAAVCRVMTHYAYPAESSRGKEISNAQKDFGPNQIVFHAGTREQDGHVVTNGGRIVGLTGLGDNLAEAYRNATSMIGTQLDHEKTIWFEGMGYRRDIGQRIQEQMK